MGFDEIQSSQSKAHTFSRQGFEIGNRHGVRLELAMVMLEWITDDIRFEDKEAGVSSIN
ncbi:predicted protein [Sclerotinia sclerotiorum 1980 UF-70]|uniref:Uncharacterized protein n=1 Tax=Sclerotinia sclerotiorum (strain ATCC 18683 / 1980 / Ss-1) TaxID=665079 RepID=A7E666_SCLS1|nr:predicted protein [Sclerotinia sclerotiorum 1980 UF-70]EDN91388.1 predicted protein [Sclerotinia sclerotiorum 1980 UF-70]